MNNNTKLIGNVIHYICPECGRPIIKNDTVEEYTINISRDNIHGEKYIYHKRCLDEMFRNKIKYEEQILE